MAQQPEALRHAEWLERSLTIGAPEAANELRRLHDHINDALQCAENSNNLTAELLKERDTLRSQIERLQNPPFTGKLDSWQAACGKACTERDELRAQVERLQAAGQVAAPAMVPVSHIALQDAWNALNPQDSNRDYFTAGVRWAERAHGITPGDGGEV